MKIIWCKDFEDIVNIARGQGWLFYLETRGKHYYYVYTGTEAELLCLAVEVKEPVKAKYVSVDEDGALKLAQTPILPTCARLITVSKDDGFEELLKQSFGQS